LAGVVVNPNAKNRAAEIKRLIRKKEAGAKYALSQPVFDEQSSVEFFKEASSVGIPILMGVFALKSNHSARALSKVPGIRLSDDLLSKLSGPDETDISELSVELCLKLARANMQHVAGFHIISGVTPKLALVLAAELASQMGKN
jgi:5,10-methylenetetrahydrofolate reductase